MAIIKHHELFGRQSLKILVTHFRNSIKRFEFPRLLFINGLFGSTKKYEKKSFTRKKLFYETYISKIFCPFGFKANYFFENPFFSNFVKISIFIFLNFLQKIKVLIF